MGDKRWAVLRRSVILAAFDIKHQLCQSPCGKPLEKLLGLVWPDVDGQTLVSWSAVVSHPLTPGQPRQKSSVPVTAAPRRDLFGCPYLLRC